MKLPQSILFLSLFTITLASLLAEAQVSDGPVITAVQLQGTGCEETAASVSLSPDAKDLSILFDNYTVDIGTGSSKPNLLRAQKDCKVFIDLSLPRDMQFAFRAVDYRGFVALPASAWAFHRFTYVSPNQQIVSMREATLQGGVNKDYTVHVEQRPERMTWSPCGLDKQKIQLLSQLGVQYYPRSSDRSLAQISLDSADASFRQNFSIEWRKCTPPAVRTSQKSTLPRTPIIPGRPARF